MNPIKTLIQKGLILLTTTTMIAVCLFLVAMVLTTSCNRPDAPAAPASPEPAALEPIVGIMYWSAFMTNANGTDAQVDGYLVTCISTETSVEGDAKNTTTYDLHNIITANGKWSCYVQAYNAISRTDISQAIEVIVSEGQFYKLATL